jgi:hypothetical protein
MPDGSLASRIRRAELESNEVALKGLELFYFGEPYDPTYWSRVQSSTPRQPCPMVPD